MMRQVAVMPLVQRLEPQEVCRWTNRGRQSFALPEDSRCIVVKVEDGTLSHINGLGQHVLLRDGTSEFQVAVGDAPPWIAGAD
jgi:hypothetical protein